MKPFATRVYQALEKVPRGRVTTYKLLAIALGSKAYRAVGTALKNNPSVPTIPCHRVIAHNLSIGGYGGKKSGKEIKKKIALLKSEGVEVNKGKVNKKFLYPSC